MALRKSYTRMQVGGRLRFAKAVGYTLLRFRFTPDRRLFDQSMAMELAVRKDSDRFVKQGAYGALQSRLRRQAGKLAEIPTVVLSAFDRSTRLLPFLFYDTLMFPAGAGAIANALNQAGFARTRAVFQLWNPNFKPSRARFDGRAIEMLLISSMHINSQRAYDAISEAWSLDAERPLVIAGGPKAIYEPYHFWPEPGKRNPTAPDVAVTGEQYVLLELLDTLLAYRDARGTMRSAFELARSDGALDTIPGLVYLAPGASVREPVLIDTGLQRLVRDLDELPGEETALGLLEPPHRGPGLSTQPLDAARVGRHARIASLLVTQGCKFNCSYCPIPAVNQKSWRYRSPESVARTIASIYDRFHIKYFFGADDNFFNRRETAEALLSAMARSTTGGRSFRERIRFATEATQFDTYRNRDLLPLARDAGVYALWFGIEDLTATLINKGQKPTQTLELFRLMRDQKISPMAMMMFHEGQPYHTRGALYGLHNQIKFLREALARALKRDGSPLRRRRIGYQLAGMAAMIWTAAKMTPYILRLLTGRPSYRTDAKETTIEIRHPENAFRRWPTTSIQKAKRMLASSSQTV